MKMASMLVITPCFTLNSSNTLHECGSRKMDFFSLPSVSLKLSNLGQSTALHYGFIEWREDGPPRAGLMRWNGQRPETEEVIA